MKITFKSSDIVIEEVTNPQGQRSNDPYPFKVKSKSLNINEEFATLSYAISYIRWNYADVGYGIETGDRAYFSEIPKPARKG